MKKIIADSVIIDGNKEILKPYLVDTLQGFLEEFCIFNVSEEKIIISLNGGNYFELEPNEGFECSTPIYRCDIGSGEGGKIKFSGIAD